MDGFLFPPEEYTDERVRSIMDGNTCRQCAHRQTVKQGYDGQNRVSICECRKSKRTKSGQLRVRVDQPACILFTQKNNGR